MWHYIYLIVNAHSNRNHNRRPVGISLESPDVASQENLGKRNKVMVVKLRNECIRLQAWYFAQDQHNAFVMRNNSVKEK